MSYERHVSCTFYRFSEIFENFSWYNWDKGKSVELVEIS